MKVFNRIVVMAVVITAGVVYSTVAAASYVYEGPVFDDPYGNAKSSAWIGRSNKCVVMIANGKPIYETCQKLFVYRPSNGDCTSFYLGGSHIIENQRYRALGGDDMVRVIRSGNFSLPTSCGNKYDPSPILYPLNYGGFAFDINAGGGNDYVIGGTGSTWIWGGSGNDQIFVSDYVYPAAYGEGGKDFLIGSGNSNTEMLLGGPGDDTIYDYGTLGTYYVNGEDGDDACDYSALIRLNCEYDI